MNLITETLPSQELDQQSERSIADVEDKLSPARQLKELVGLSGRERFELQPAAFAGSPS
jgi:hypothetical protein